MVTVWLCFALIGVIGKLPLAARWDYWGPLIEFISAYRYLLALQLTPHRPSLVDLYGFFSKTKASFDSLPLAKPPFGPRMITVVQINILARELMGDMFKNSNDQLALIAILSFQVSSRCSAATALLSFALCFLFSLSSSSQLLLYFTAIKPGNFNQVAQREFLQGQERSEPLFNAVVLSFLFSSPPHLSFLPLLNSTLALYSLWFNFQFVLQNYFLGGRRSGFVLMCLYNTRLWYSQKHSLTDTCIWISNSVSAYLSTLFDMKVTLRWESLFHVSSWQARRDALKYV